MSLEPVETRNWDRQLQTGACLLSVGRVICGTPRMISKDDDNLDIYGSLNLLEAFPKRDQWINKISFFLIISFLI